MVYAEVTCFLSPDPVYAIYPILVVMKKKGIQNPILVACITGQTIVAHAQILFEVGLFGLEFFLYRIALIMGPLAGILYILLSKVIPDDEWNLFGLTMCVYCLTFKMWKLLDGILKRMNY